MTIYLGWADELEYPTGSAVFYAPGQDIPGITGPDMAALELLGHTFAGEAAPSPPPFLPDPATIMEPNAESLEDPVDDNPSGIGPLEDPEPTDPAQDAAPPPDEAPVQ